MCFMAVYDEICTVNMCIRGVPHVNRDSTP